MAKLVPPPPYLTFFAASLTCLDFTQQDMYQSLCKKREIDFTHSFPWFSISRIKIILLYNWYVINQLIKNFISLIVNFQLAFNWNLSGNYFLWIKIKICNHNSDKWFKKESIHDSGLIYFQRLFLLNPNSIGGGGGGVKPWL